MSRASERMIRDRTHAQRTLSSLSDALLVDLVRRAVPRATSDVTKSSGPRSRGTYSDPTAAAVMKAEVSDPVFEAVKEIAESLSDLSFIAARIDEKIRFITGAQERMKASTIASCLACGREIAGTPRDRVRSGYCSADYQRWLREGRPYRATFERKIQAETLEK